MSKTKTTLIRINEETKILLDSLPYKGKGYSNIIQELIHTYKKHARRHMINQYLMDDNFTEMDLLDSIDTYLHYHYKEDPEYEWLIPNLRQLIDDNETRHGTASKTELELIDGD